MKLSPRFSLFLSLTLSGGACLLALSSCGDKEDKPEYVEEGDPGKLSPVESYEELLSLRLKDVEQMTDLVASIQDRAMGEAAMEELGRLTERLKLYDMNCGRLMILNPRVHEESRKEHPAFHSILQERVDQAHERMMEGLLKIHQLGYYDSGLIREGLEKYGLNLTEERMAQYLNDRILPFLKAYLDQYSAMVDMLEGIDNKVAAEAYAVSVVLQGRMVKEQVGNISRLEKEYRTWIPGFERYYHNGLEKMRRKADEDRKRAFRVLLKLATVRMYDSPAMQKAVVSLEMEQPRLMDFQEFWADPIMTMEEFCLCLERVQFLLRGIKDPATADQRAMEVVEVVAKLKRLRYVVDIFQKSGRMNMVKTKDMERISRRAEDAEMAVSSTMAHLIVETDVVSRSPLLSRAMGFYRYVMYTQ
ncbi:hypothetical protein ABGM91_01325 [Akkermansia muciniphila]|uniref:hypothetical protein n=1 Tax=Akkermansia muciniphila TaxID=239935 RepID=UPI0033AA49E1